MQVMKVFRKSTSSLENYLEEQQTLNLQVPSIETKSLRLLEGNYFCGWKSGDVVELEKIVYVIKSKQGQRYLDFRRVNVKVVKKVETKHSIYFLLEI